MGGNGVDDLGRFTHFFGQLGADQRMRPFDFVVNGFTDIVEQPHTSCQLLVQVEFGRHDA